MKIVKLLHSKIWKAHKRLTNVVVEKLEALVEGSQAASGVWKTKRCKITMCRRLTKQKK